MKVRTVLICGAGAVGSNITLNLAYDLPKDVGLAVIDYDKVAMRNITAGTQVYLRSHINMLKVQALNQLTAQLARKGLQGFITKVICVADITSMMDKLLGPVLVVDAFDNNDARKIVAGITKADVVHIGFSADLGGEIMWGNNWNASESSAKSSEVDVCTMAGVRSFVQTLTATASMNIMHFLNTGEKQNYYIHKNMLIRKL